MESRKIMLGTIGILLVVGFFYWYNQNNTKNESADKKEVLTEKTNKENNINNNAKDKESESVKNENDVSETNPNEIEDGIVYYYGAECPHCKDVLAYFDENDIYNKVKFTKKEVWHNKTNNEELRNAALKCGKNPADIGVPFVFSQGKCYMGGPEVMDFFAKEAGIKK